MRRLMAARSVADVEPRHAALAGGGRQQAGEHLDGGGLAGAVGPQEAEDLAGLDLEGHAVHGREVAEAAGEVHAPRTGAGRRRPASCVRHRRRPSHQVDEHVLQGGLDLLGVQHRDAGRVQGAAQRRPTPRARRHQRVHRLAEERGAAHAGSCPGARPGRLGAGRRGPPAWCPSRDACSAAGVSSARVRPSLRSTTRSQRSASSRYEVDTTTVIPSATISWRMSQSSRREMGSTPKVGSSRRSTRGWCIRAARERELLLHPAGELRPPGGP